MTEAMDSECIGEKIQRAVQRAESRKQRAESSERCPPEEKTHIAGGGGHQPVPGPQDRDRHHNSEARWADR